MSATTGPGDLRDRAFEGTLRLSIRQLATVGILAVGSIVLARLLGAELLGLHAIVTFLLGLLGPILDFGVHQQVIRQPRVSVDDDFLRTAFTVKLGIGLLLSVLVAFGLGPLVDWWYGRSGLYWLLVLAVLSNAISSPFRLSLSLLEKDLDYTKIATVEFLGSLAFYLPAAFMAAQGFGLWSLAAGEVVRGLVPIGAYGMRPFALGIGVSRSVLRDLVRFGSAYLASVFSWMLNSGLNPILVAKIAGLEAAGYVRVAEGLVAQASFLKAIGDRIAYPMLAQIQPDAARVVELVKRWRLYQFVLGTLPLLALGVVGPAIVPRLYGESWRPVTVILMLMGLSTALSTVFGVYSAALITAGQAWRVTRFHLAYGAMLWLLTPGLVLRFGYVGYPLALVLAAPSYAAVQRSFEQTFGPIEYWGTLATVTASWSIAALSWLLGGGWRSAIAFLVGQCVLVVAVPSLRANASAAFGEVLRWAKGSAR